MAEETTSSAAVSQAVNDVLQLLYGDLGNVANEIAPDISETHINSPAVCLARGRLVDLFGEAAVAQIERDHIHKLRAIGDLRFAQGKHIGRRGGKKFVGPLEAAVTNGLQAVVRELRRPRMALFNDAGNLIGSAPADPAKP